MVDRALAACGSPDGVEQPPSETRTYVISELRIDPVDGDVAVGFDLDGMTSTGEGATCEERVIDFRSADDPPREGVDNALARGVPNLAGSTDGCRDAPDPAGCLGELTTAQIALRPQLWLVEVAGIDTYVGDDQVAVSLFRATFVDAPELVDGRLAPKQVFDAELAARDADARIVDGVLEAQLGTIPRFDLAITEELVATSGLSRTRLEAAITPWRLEVGVLGGALSVEELCLGEDTCVETTARIADLAPRPGDPTRCTELSMAVSFAAVSAYRAAP